MQDHISTYCSHLILSYYGARMYKSLCEVSKTAEDPSKQNQFYKNLLLPTPFSHMIK